MSMASTNVNVYGLKYSFLKPSTTFKLTTDIIFQIAYV